MSDRYADAKRMAREVWPWLGLDHKQVGIEAKKAGAPFPKTVVGVLGYQAVERWLNENREHISAEFLCEVASLGWKAGKSHSGRIKAMSKNEAARNWVINEWSGRVDRGQSKASFARQYAPLLKAKFRLGVTTDTIKRDWLPKG